MKKITKRVVTVVSLGVTILSSMMIGGLAASKQEKIEAYMDYGITIKLNGQVKTLSNSSGTRTYPIRYKGTTYVPLRSVSELVGLEVNWDGNTETVMLGNDGSNAKVDLTKVEITNAKHNDSRTIIMSNMSDLVVPDGSSNRFFDAGIKCDLVSYVLHDKDDVKYFNVSSKDTLEFTAWCNNDVNVYVYDENGNTIDSFDAKANEFNVRKLNISGISKVAFAGYAKNSGSMIKILDPVIYNK